ncbi:MAG TPA: cytochrome P460 family protein [Burkholderiaceae bacterium]
MSITTTRFAAMLCSILFCTAAHAAPESAPQLDYPADYRNWIFLTSGLDMNYSDGAGADHHMFDNVFVNPEAYKVFQATGRWPDKTIIAKEVRGAQTKGSINRSGMFQQADVMELEIHMKDEKRFPEQWAFFVFGDTKPATAIPKEAQCYACHGSHGAVDNTFVQFYPTLMPIAQGKKTLSAGYLKDESARK